MLVQFGLCPWGQLTPADSPETESSANTFTDPVDCFGPKLWPLHRFINPIDYGQQRGPDSEFHGGAHPEALSKRRLAEAAEKFFIHSYEELLPAARYGCPTGTKSGARRATERPVLNRGEDQRCGTKSMI